MASFVETLDTPDGPIRYHMTMGKAPRVVPAHERHSWTRIPKRGETARCTKCGCVKCYRLDYNTVYRQKGSAEILTERPACTGTPTA